ncbi:MAG: DUF996 domain-containing protein [Candidatus Bathyarchaeia archaeon]
MDFQTSKNLGGAGSLLLFSGPLLALFHGFGGILLLIGAMLVLIALKGFADHYKEAGIFNNALYGFITAVVGAVISTVLFIVTAVRVMEELGLDLKDVAGWPRQIGPEMVMELLRGMLGGVLISLLVIFVFAIITAMLYRKSLNLLSSKSGIGLFSTAGLLLLIGTILTIVIVGFVIIWVTFLLMAVAFFSMKPLTPTKPAA